ncbi:MAG: hypothetical protein HZB68_01780 [Candidatus Aenigmarchaeota archaeon]|nr:hypothetical protein [Candidatus Aenigmarchaeota archaeon]
MVEFQTIESKDVKFGTNNFVEISRKKAVTEEGENVFISISRGFFAPDGGKRYRKNFSLPDNGDVIQAVLEALSELKK